MAVSVMPRKQVIKGASTERASPKRAQDSKLHKESPTKNRGKKHSSPQTRFSALPEKEQILHLI